MSKLIGTNPNQVPSNADLGTAAFMDAKDFLLSRGSEMSTINSVIPGNASDLFIYDTSKDSDGGAWRKRTQNTSWYNEKLNTTTRGSRREFPAVAVIVAKVDRIAIYDGDDPTLPMWMTIEPGGIIDWATAAQTRLNIHMLNGQLAEVGSDGGNIFSFIEDYVYIMYASANYPVTSSRTIEGRNNPSSYISSTGNAIDVYVVAWYAMEDVAMTVLPNAPIDDKTGLPTPTIAVATDKGVSVIRDDKSIITITSSTAAGGGYDPHHVSFDKDNRLVLVQAYDADGIYLDIFDNIPISNVGQALSYSAATSYTYLDTGLNITGTTTARTFKDLVHTKDDIAMGTNKQLTLLDSVPGSPTQSMVAYIDDDFNTGWMVGDTKLATLSDTSTTTSLSGTNRCAADNFSSGWTVTSGSNMSIGSNVLSVVDTSNSGSTFCDQNITTIVGQEYVIDVTATGVSGTGIGLYVTGYGGPVLGYQWEPTYTFTATTTSTTVRLYRFEGHTGSGTISSVIIKEAAADRSINGNGLKAFGTVPKTPVMPGAELMAYGPFTSSNYLQQPYNSDLDFGTGDFMYSMWIYRNSLPPYTHERWFGTASTSTDERIDIFSNGGTDNIAFYSIDNGAVKGDVRITGIRADKWHCLHFTRQGNTYRIYHDGELRGTNYGSNTLANYQGASGNRRTHIGASEHWDSGHAVLDGKIALAKISGTVPTPEQIRKMYREEKELFRENAKATLYAPTTNTKVEALAYDDATNLLHVGNGSGRSDFRGLRRINNTTRPITVAMSAEDGFVVEE